MSAGHVLKARVPTMNGLYPVRPGHAADLRPDVFPKALQAQSSWSQTAFVSTACSIPVSFERQTVAVDVQLYGYRWINLKKRPDRPVGRWYKNESVTWSAIAAWPRMYRFFSDDSQCIIFAGLYHILPGSGFVLTGSPSMSSIQNLSYKPYTDNAAGKVNIIPFQGKEFARADAGTHMNARVG